MKLLWAVDGWYKGNAYGFSVHRSKMREALLALGVEITNDPAEAFDLAIHITGPSLFKPVPGARNILFTATETTKPAVWSTAVDGADALVVPCTMSAKTCEPFYSGPIFVCPEGSDPAIFSYRERALPASGDEPLRFLFMGDASCNRKGHDIALDAWTRWLQSGRMISNSQLYMKVQGLGGPELQYYGVEEVELLPGQSVPFRFTRRDSPGLPGIIIDQRNLTTGEIVELYHSAHVFLFPSMGEGFGLTLADALATGLPSIWTHFSAMLDYASRGPEGEVGYPIDDFQLVPMKLVDDLTPGAFAPPGNMGAEVRLEALIAKVEEVVWNYAKALELGRAASARMHSRYTWAKAALRFKTICEEVLS